LGIARIQGKKMNAFWGFITKLFILYKSNKPVEVSANTEPSREDIYKLQQYAFPLELIYSIHQLIYNR
jgi:hypothetical protein